MTNASLISRFYNDYQQFALWITGIGLTFALFYLYLHGHGNLLAALIFAIPLLILSRRDKGTAALLTLAYLYVLGDLRRISDALFGHPSLDILLLVGPLLSVSLALPVLIKIKAENSMAKAMLVLLGMMVLGIFYIGQGGIIVGLGGALFYIVPILWFWIGQQYGSSDVLHHTIYRVLLPISIAAAVLGLCQTYFGFLPYQQAWIDQVKSNYGALDIGGVTRSFGFSVSSAEYATVLEIGAAGFAATYFTKKRVWSIWFPLVTVAMFLASGRTVVFKLAFALAVLFTVRGHKKLNAMALLRLGMFALLALGGVVLFASRAAQIGLGAGTAAQVAISHQVSGLANPLDRNQSTAGVHTTMLLEAIAKGFRYPIGHGLGSTTEAAMKFGTYVGSSEIDFGDMFVNLGFVGGFLYLYIIFVAIRVLIKYLRSASPAISLPVTIILTSTIGTWLIGGQYSTAATMFFLLGACTRQINVRTKSGSVGLRQPVCYAA